MSCEISPLNGVSALLWELEALPVRVTTFSGILAGLDSSYTGSVKLTVASSLSSVKAIELNLDNATSHSRFKLRTYFPISASAKILNWLRIFQTLISNSRIISGIYRAFEPTKSLEKPPKRSAERGDGQASFEQYFHPQTFSSSTSREHIWTRHFKGRS